jgi:hypothetical protein
MRVPRVALLAVMALLAGCNKKDATAKKDTSDQSAASSPLTAPLDYLSAQAAAKKMSERVISMAPVQQAIQQFHAAEDRYPRSLNELLNSGYIGRIPVPPPGQMVYYNPQTGDISMGPATAAPGGGAQRQSGGPQTYPGIPGLRTPRQ